MEFTGAPSGAPRGRKRPRDTYTRAIHTKVPSVLRSEVGASLWSRIDTAEIGIDVKPATSKSQYTAYTIAAVRKHGAGSRESDDQSVFITSPPLVVVSAHLHGFGYTSKDDEATKAKFFLLCRASNSTELASVSATLPNLGPMQEDFFTFMKELSRTLFVQMFDDPNICGTAKTEARQTVSRNAGAGFRKEAWVAEFCARGTSLVRPPRTLGDMSHDDLPSVSSSSSSSVVGGDISTSAVSSSTSFPTDAGAAKSRSDPTGEDRHELDVEHEDRVPDEDDDDDNDNKDNYNDSFETIAFKKHITRYVDPKKPIARSSYNTGDERFAAWAAEGREYAPVTIIDKDGRRLNEEDNEYAFIKRGDLVIVTWIVHPWALKGNKFGIRACLCKVQLCVSAPASDFSHGGPKLTALFPDPLPTVPLLGAPPSEDSSPGR